MCRTWVRAAGCGLIVALSVSACAVKDPGPFVWAEDWQEPVAPPDGGYVIGIGDALNVLVWDQEKMSARVRVRNDGRVSLPFLDDVNAAGLTPVALARALEARLTKFIVTPQVTVVIEEAKPLSVSVLGEVDQPGLYTLDPGAGVAQALAAAGGLRDFAHRDQIYLLRSGDGTTRVRMTYADITSGKGRASTIRLRSGDIVVVE